jgi:hypothetical protein
MNIGIRIFRAFVNQWSGAGDPVWVTLADDMTFSGTAWVLMPTKGGHGKFLSIGLAA